MKRSIGSKFLTILIPAICGVFLLMAVAIGGLQYQTLSKELEAKGERTAKLAALAMEYPAWNVDSRQLSNITDAILTDKEVATTIVATDAKLTDMTAATKASVPDLGTLLPFTRQIFHRDPMVPGNDTVVGSVTIYLTRHYMVAKVRNSLLALGASLLVLLTTVILLNHFIQQRVIMAPLETLIDRIESNTQTQRFTAVQLASEDEIGLLADTFNLLMLQLKERTDDLQTMNLELETRVMQRTKQLSEAHEKLTLAYSQLSQALCDMQSKFGPK